MCNSLLTVIYAEKYFWEWIFVRDSFMGWDRWYMKTVSTPVKMVLNEAFFKLSIGPLQ